MPLIPSNSLISLQCRLQDMAIKLGRALNWKQTADYCSLHGAETSIIPLGIRDGYPASIDFGSLVARLNDEWLFTYMAKLWDTPAGTPSYREVMAEIRAIGKTQWAAPGYQTSMNVLNWTTPG